MIKRLALGAVLLALVCGAMYFISRTSQPSTAQADPANVRAETNSQVQPSNAAAQIITGAQGGSSALPSTRELDPAVNPYASALREPGKSKRSWDANFLKSFSNAAAGDAIQFELTDGRVASGAVRITQFRDGELVYVSGELTAPEAGKFFFLSPPALGKAGKAVGVIEFPASKTAYRIEPTGPNGEPELWQRRLDEVLCQTMPLKNESVETNETSEIPPLRPGGVPDNVPSYNSNIVSLQSYPGASGVLLLDFFGGYTPTWGGVGYARPNVSNDQIKDLWKRVAEDYMPFNINVTTDIRVYQNAPDISRQRCVFTPSTSAVGSGAAGVAYIGSWNWGSDTVCWSVYTSGKSGAEVGAHEPGHTLGLGHQGTSTSGYYSGHGSGATGWAPIMGVGYYQPVTTFARGEYANANNTEDETSVITSQNNNVEYRPDDTGDYLAISRYLEIFGDSSAYAEGVIERQDDTDSFQFTTTGGRVALTARPLPDWANLAVTVMIADAFENIVAFSSTPQNVLYSSVDADLPAGTYTLRVSGAGRNDAWVDGFTSYGSLGYYSIAGFVTGGRLPTRLSVMEHSTNGAVVGSVQATNPANLHTYTISSGNANNTFSIDSNGVVTVNDNTLLDYNSLATNTMLAVQFELLVDIVDETDPLLTEPGRRVIVSVLSSNLNYPLAVTGFNAAVIAPYNATTNTPLATRFDLLNGWCFYQAGLEFNSQVGGSGGGQGLPPGGRFVSQFDGTTFQLEPYGATNALLVGRNYPATGTLTLATPQSFNTLAILASSANGGGQGNLVLNFIDGSQSPVLKFNAPDWYNTVTNVAIQGFGRLRLGQSTLFTENPAWNNPNLYQTTINLAALGLNRPVASLRFTNPGTSPSQNAGVFAVSGSLMPPQVVITKQPQSTTNNNPLLASTFAVVAMGEAPLAYQWYKGNPVSGALLADQTNATLVINPVSTNDAGSYFVIVTNSINSVTSSIATLTVHTAPIITQQPNPTNIFRFTGKTLSLSVAANAAQPLSYYWRFNGDFIEGATAPSYVLPNLQLTNSGNYTVLLSNAFGMVTSSVVTLTVASSPTYPYALAVLADSPIGYWRLDETNGAVAHDYVGANNGGYTNVSLGQAGNNLVDTHKAARFGPSQNSYVGGVPIDFVNPTSAVFSVEAWVNGGPQTQDSGLITKGTGAGGEQFNLDCGAANHAFRFFVRDGSGNAHLANGTVVPNSQWHHLVGVCDQRNGRVILYVDGVSNASASIVAGSGLLGSSNAVTFGSRQQAAGAYNFQFNGSMEEVAIYNYALNAARVQAHYRAATNRAPVFLANPFTAPGAISGSAYSENIATNATEPNGDAIMFGKVSGPAWLSVAANGLLSGTPANTDGGTNSFVVSARDPAGLSNTATLFIPVNGPPVFAGNPFAMPGTNVNEFYSAALAGRVTEPNNETVTFAKLSGPAWLNVASDGALSGTPSVADVGTNTFSIQATDSTGLASAADMLIRINGPPVFTTNPLTLANAQAGQAYAANVSSAVTDPNAGELLVFAKLSGPAWLNVASDGSLSGTPQSADAGTNTFSVRVTDSGGLFDTANAIVVVDSTTSIVATISREGSDLRLTWVGGSAPFTVLSATNAGAASWETFATGLSTNSLTLAPTNSALFYRVIGQ